MEIGHERTGSSGPQRLGRELRHIRDLAGLTGRELARRIEISQSKVSRIEAGTTVPSLPEVRAWAEAVGASDGARERVLALTEAAHTDVRRWGAELKHRPHLQSEIGELEWTSRITRVFQPALVPGLLQTAEYSRLVFTMFDAVPYSRDKLAEALAARLDRQLLLYDEGRTFKFLITEGALRWCPGTPAVLATQLDRISSLSTLSNVSIGVLPFGVRATVPYSHSFIIYGPPDDDENDIVSIEMIHANTYLKGEMDVDTYRKRWDGLESLALQEDEARLFLNGLGRELRERNA
ncbi:helix-turn-helix domain-containing protein [Actinomadura madurae]|uniref:helix-turn-helix domain-containing protein n=1 Tax=Actinomadura madurae TaxID=1993 RepID=UPI0039999386